MRLYPLVLILAACTNQAPDRAAILEQCAATCVVFQDASCPPHLRVNCDEDCADLRTERCTQELFDLLACQEGEGCIGMDPACNSLRSALTACELETP